MKPVNTLVSLTIVAFVMSPSRLASAGGECEPASANSIGVPSFAQDGDPINYTYTCSIPVAPIPCDATLDGATFFKPDNPPNDPNQCDATNGLVLPAPAVTLAPGEFIRFSAVDNPAIPNCGAGDVNCEIVDPNLQYIADHADEVAGELTVFGCCKFVALPGGEDTQAQAEDDTTVLHPNITIDKDAEPATICEGRETEVTYSYEVQWDLERDPPGDTDVVDVMVTDDTCAPVVRGPDNPGNNNDTLELGEVFTFSCTTMISTETTNTATATAVEPNLERQVEASDDFTVTAEICDVSIDKTCVANEPDNINEISIEVCNDGTVQLQNCMVSDEYFLGDPACPGEGTGMAPTTLDCPPELSTLDPGECQTCTGTIDPCVELLSANNAEVTCDVVGIDQTVGDDDCDECEPCGECPDLDVDKQISCDGGMTFVDVGFNDGIADFCNGWNAFDGNAAEDVIVRYVARTVGGNNFVLENCQLTDTNSGILPAPVPIPGIAPDPGDIIHEVAVPCSDALDAMEPDTATLTCDCLLGGEVDQTLESTDEADFECLTPDLSIEKVCDANQDENINEITIEVCNTGDAPLENCVVSDEYFLGDADCPGSGDGMSVPLDCPAELSDLAPGECQTCTGTIDPCVPEDSANNASVTCDVVETDKMITAEDCDVCPGCGAEGCTPGYWKLIDSDPAKASHECNWAGGYTPETLFCSVFDCTGNNAFNGMTLIQVLEQGGGGHKALGRHTVAALLNAAGGNVAYPISEQDVIDMFNATWPCKGTECNALKSIFATENEDNCCPLAVCKCADSGEHCNVSEASNGAVLCDEGDGVCQDVDNGGECVEPPDVAISVQPAPSDDRDSVQEDNAEALKVGDADSAESPEAGTFAPSAGCGVMGLFGLLLVFVGLVGLRLRRKS